MGSEVQLPPLKDLASSGELLFFIHVLVSRESVCVLSVLFVSFPTLMLQILPRTRLQLRFYRPIYICQSVYLSHNFLNASLLSVLHNVVLK